MKSLPWATAAALSILAVVACGTSDQAAAVQPVGGGTVDGIETPPTKGKSSSGSAATSGGASSSGNTPVEACHRDLVAVPTDGLTRCGDGKGYCYDTDEIPHAVTLSQAECSATQLCVPDAVFPSGGKPLPACTSPYGAGVCGSTLIKEVSDRAKDLSTDGCTNGDFCVPCMDPNSGVPTNACVDIGLYDHVCAPGTEDDAGGIQSAPVDQDAGPPQPVVLPACCSYANIGFDYSAGTCVPDGRLDAQEQSAGLPHDSCATNFTCAPNELYAGGAGNGIFSGCWWEGDWFSDGQGVCVDQCFLSPDQIYQLDDNGVESDNCGPTQRCIPCEKAPAGTPGCF